MIEFNGRPAARCDAHTRVLFSCTGVGIMNRGIESFFREAFDGLQGMDGVETLLLKGGGPSVNQERIAWTLPRTGRLATTIGTLTGRTGSVVEQWSSLPSAVRTVRRFRPHVIFYSEANLGFLLYRFRKQIGVPFKLLFSNGGPCHPPFVRTDYVHQVAPQYHDEAIAAGEAPSKHFLVPYGIRVPAEPPAVDLATKRTLRTKLGLPLDRQLLLSVGWISATHKRMDYVIRELSMMPEPRPYLLLVGAIDDSSAEIIRLGQSLLGPAGFSATSVPYQSMSDYYRAADCFVLASLQEGFGRVYLEALMHGLPTLAHRHPVMEYVVGSAGILTDMRHPGGLLSQLPAALNAATDPSAARCRWEYVRDRFSWDALRPQYREMFLSCAATAEAAIKS